VVALAARESVRGDADYAKKYLDKLREVRDRVLDHRLKLGDGAVLLDVGGRRRSHRLGALDRVGPTGRVIFSDISRSLLEHCRSLAAQLAVSERCEFLEARAEDLRPVADDTVRRRPSPGTPGRRPPLAPGACPRRHPLDRSRGPDRPRDCVPWMWLVTTNDNLAAVAFSRAGAGDRPRFVAARCPRPAA
jgi:hypothetical protein